MPASPVITSLTPHTVVEGVDDLAIIWDATAPGDKIRIYISTNNVLVVSISLANLPDNGHYTIPQASFQVNPGASSGIYPLYVQLFRIKQVNTVDPDYQGGFSKAIRGTADTTTAAFQVP